MFNRKYIFKWWILYCHLSFRGVIHNTIILHNGTNTSVKILNDVGFEKLPILATRSLMLSSSSWCIDGKKRTTRDFMRFLVLQPMPLLLPLSQFLWKRFPRPPRPSLSHGAVCPLCPWWSRSRTLISNIQCAASRCRLGHRMPPEPHWKEAAPNLRKIGGLIKPPLSHCGSTSKGLTVLCVYYKPTVLSLISSLTVT